jgi:hypothetical protein
VRPGRSAETDDHENQRVHNQFRIALRALGTSLLVATALAAAPAHAQSEAAPAPTEAKRPAFRLGAHAELDLGILFVMQQGAGFAGGAVWGPFRAGLSYATFLSNPSLGGVPKGFSMRANYIVGINVSYFIAQTTDEGLYVQAMFHIKQQGITNDNTGDHKNLNSLATGLELGYV